MRAVLAAATRAAVVTLIVPRFPKYQMATRLAVESLLRHSECVCIYCYGALLLWMTGHRIDGCNSTLTISHLSLGSRCALITSD
jgi:hypothetical protein